MITRSPMRLPYFYSVNWDMQTMSVLRNGLPGRKICGATNFSSPYDEVIDAGPGTATLRRDLYRDMLRNRDSRRGRWVRDNLDMLRGHNLFCICRAGVPCHGDILIPLANDPDARSQFFACEAA